MDFYNHAAADSGRRALSPPGFNLRNRALTVTWAEPKRVQEGGGGHGTSEIKAIYVSKLPQQVKSDQLSVRSLGYGLIYTSGFGGKQSIQAELTEYPLLRVFTACLPRP